MVSSFTWSLACWSLIVVSVTRLDDFFGLNRSLVDGLKLLSGFLNALVVHNLALVPVLNHAVLLNLTDVLIEVDVVHLELAFNLERWLVLLLLLGQSLSAILNQSSAFDVLLRDVFSHLHLLTLVLHALEQ